MTKLKLYVSLNLIFIILAVVLGYIQYGWIGLGVMLLLTVLLGIISLVGFIPVIGVIIYGWVGFFYITPWVLSLAALPYSWVVTLLLFLNGIVAVGCTLKMIERVFTSYWRWPS